MTALGRGAGLGTTVVRAGKAFRLDGELALEAGDHLRTAPTAEALVSLSTGTRLRLPPDGDLELTEVGAVQRFTLGAGLLRAEVAKLKPGQRFLVDTADLEVEVRGTSFEVAVEEQPRCRGGSRTEVRVLEGVVTVRGSRGEIRLAAGQRWPGPCPEERRARSADARPGPRRAAVAATPAPAPSTLAEENDLYAAALEASRAGHPRDALRYLDELLTRFPAGPLTESARVERRQLETEQASAR